MTTTRKPYQQEAGPLTSVQLPKLVDEPSWLLWHLNLEATLNAEGLIKYVRQSIEKPKIKYQTGLDREWTYSRRRAYSIILSTLSRPILDQLLARGFNFRAGDPCFLMRAANLATYVPRGPLDGPVHITFTGISNQESLDAFLAHSSYARLRYCSIGGEPNVGSDETATCLLNAVRNSHPMVYNKHIKRDPVVWDDVFRDLRSLADEELRNAPPEYTERAERK